MSEPDLPEPPGASAAVGDREVYRRLLRDPGYRNLFFAMLTSSLGDWIGLFAIVSLTVTIEGAGDDAAFALAGVLIARVLPSLIIGPVAGVLADRWDRKRTMIATDVGRGLVMILLAFAADSFQLGVATFTVEVLAMLFIPAKDATVPNIVDNAEDLVHANQLSLLVTYGTLPIGAGLMALFSAVSGQIADSGFLAERPEALAVWVNALTFFVSGMFITGIPASRTGRGQTPPPEEVVVDDGPSAWEELKEGFVFIVAHPFIGSLIIGVMAAFFAAGVVFTAGPFFATVVNAGENGFGVIGAVVGAGLAAGIAAAPRLSRRIGKERLFAPGIGVSGVALFLTAISPRLDVAAIPAFVMGAGAGLAFLIGYTMLQEHVDDDLRGRTFAAFNTGGRVSLFVALALGTLMVGAIGRTQPDPETGVYGYNLLGGERVTLIGAAVIALLGAVWTGRALYRALTEEQDEILHAPQPPLHGLPGFFIAFEGGEGAGKSTQMRRLAEVLGARTGIEVVVTREPGGTPLGEKIREVLLDPANDAMGDRAEALLYAAARAQHADRVLRPALARGAIVLSDRYIDSSIVYQGHARGLGASSIERLNRWATSDLVPDLVVLLDIDPVTGLERAGARAEADRLESAGASFHEAVNAAFRSRALRGGRRWLLLDGSGDPEELTGRIMSVLSARRPDLVPPLPGMEERVEALQAELGGPDPATGEIPIPGRSGRVGTTPPGTSPTDVETDDAVSPFAPAGAAEAAPSPPPLPEELRASRPVPAARHHHPEGEAPGATTERDDAWPTMRLARPSAKTAPEAGETVVGDDDA